MAAADPTTSPADPHSGWGLAGNLRFLPRQHVLLLLSELRRLSAWQDSYAGVLGPRLRAQLFRPLALPRRLRSDDLRSRNRSGSRATLFQARKLFLQSLPARLPGIRGRAGLPHDTNDSEGCAFPIRAAGGRSVPPAPVERSRGGWVYRGRKSRNGAAAHGGAH